jgi:hypothetical protein
MKIEMKNSPSDYPGTGCPKQDVLLAYIAGRLDPAQSLLFEKHSEQCASCAALGMSQTAVWQSLDEWKPAPVSESFNRELWRRIDADSRKRPWTLRFGFWKQLAPLAVAVALVITGYVFDHQGKHSVTIQLHDSPSIVVTASEADQLDRALDDIQLLQEVDTGSALAKPASSVM